MHSKISERESGFNFNIFVAAGPTPKYPNARREIINCDILDLDGNGRSEIIRAKRKKKKKKDEKISTTSTNHENPMAFLL